MTEQNTQNTAKPRTPKATGPKAHVVTIGGNEWIITLDNVRVASASDLNRALDGELPRAHIADAKAQS